MDLDIVIAELREELEKVIQVTQALEALQAIRHRREASQPEDDSLEIRRGPRRRAKPESQSPSLDSALG